MGCSVCGSDVPLVKNKKHCVECKSKYQHRYYLKNKKYFKDKCRGQKKELRSFIQSLKKEKPCIDCGIVYPHYIMDYDHKYDKKYNVSRMVTCGSKEKILEEISKCDLVCANCHRERTHGSNKQKEDRKL